MFYHFYSQTIPKLLPETAVKVEHLSIFTAPYKILGNTLIFVKPMVHFII